MDISIRNYNFDKAKIEPVIHQAEMVGLHSELPFIRKNKEEVFPIIVGIVLYRQLNHLEKQSILRQARDLGDSRFFGKIQGLTAIMMTKPSWNSWCLSDAELRDYFDLNKSVSNLISNYFITIDDKFDVAAISGAIYGISSSGVKGFISESSGKKMVEAALRKANLSKTAAKTGSKAFFIVVIIASVMKKFSDADVKSAKSELLNRGLLRPEDL